MPSQRCVSWTSIAILFVGVEIPAPWSSRRCAAPTAKLIPMSVLYDKKPAELEKLSILFTGENAVQVLIILLPWPLFEHRIEKLQEKPQSIITKLVSNNL